MSKTIFKPSDATLENVLSPIHWTASDWTAVATVGTLIVAAAAAGYARGQLRDARQLREDQARPFVVVDFQSSPAFRNMIDLVVENVGKTLAKDVRIEFSPPLETSQTDPRYNLNESVLVRSGIPTLPPGRRVTALFDLSHKRHGSGLPMQYTATVRCKDAHRNEQDPLTYVLDLSHRYGIMQADVYGLHDAAKALKEIEQQIKELTGGGGLNVWMRDGDKRDADEEKWARDVEQRLAASQAEKADPATS